MTANKDELFHRLQRLLREKAELKAAEPGEIEASFTDTDKLVHELHVHQIELEMQNEELRRAHADLEITEKRYQDLYEHAPVGYFTLDPEGMIVEANHRSAELLGMERKQLALKRFIRFVADEDKDNWYRYILRVKRKGGKQACQLRLINAGGAALCGHLEALLVKKNGSRPFLLVALSDITPLKLAEQELRIHAVAFEVQEGIIVSDAAKRIIRTNRAFCRMTGYTAEEIMGQALSFLASSFQEPRFYENLWWSVGSEGRWQGEIWYKHKTGDVRPALLSMAQVTGEQGYVTHYVACFTDITAQKQAEKTLHETQRDLENRLDAVRKEFEQSRKEVMELNTALNVLLQQRNTNLTEARTALTGEMERTVLPFLKRLKSAEARDKQKTRLIGIIESNIERLAEAYGSSGNLPVAYQRLSPVEIQVASLVRQGLPTKVIASTLNLSSGTVCIHRKHIRKKLGLSNKSINLQSYLQSLSQKNAHSVGESFH